MKKVISLILSVVLVTTVLFSFNIFAFGATDDSGACGDSVSYTFDGTNGILTLSGTGATKTYGAGNTSLTRTPWYSYRTDVKKVIVGEGITALNMYVFSKLTNLTTVVLPSTLKTISGYAFYQDSLLKTINLGDTVLTSIGLNAFEDCTALNDVVLPETMQSINDYAFRNSGVKTVNFPKTCTSIGQYAFYGCSMSIISLPEEITNVGMRAFANNSYLLNVFIYNADLTYGGNDPFNGCQSSLTFHGHAGSTTETYATEKGYKFVSIDNCAHEVTHKVITLAATCTTAGSQQIVCDNCGNTVRTESIPATGHTFEAIQVDNQSATNGHIFTYYRCSTCNDESYDYIETTHIQDDDGNYVWIEGYYTETKITTANCTTAGTTLRTCAIDGCSKRGYTYTPALGHDIAEWTVTTEATCTTNGNKEGLCSRCNKTISETIKGEHSYTGVSSPIDETGHRTITYTCAICGDSYETISHQLWVEGYYTNKVITAPTCLVTGVSTDTCNVNGCTETRRNVVNATGHSFKFENCDGTTCNYKCANCTTTRTQSLSNVMTNYISNVGSISSHVLGYYYDVNNDGYVNARDYVKIVRFNDGLDLNIIEEPTTEATTVAE